MKRMNIGEVIKHNGNIAIHLKENTYLALDEFERLEVITINDEEVEPLEYEHLTDFLRRRLLFLNHRYGGE